MTILTISKKYVRYYKCNTMYFGYKNNHIKKCLDDIFCLLFFSNFDKILKWRSSIHINSGVEQPWVGSVRNVFIKHIQIVLKDGLEGDGLDVLKPSATVYARVLDHLSKHGFIEDTLEKSVRNFHRKTYRFTILFTRSKSSPTVLGMVFLDMDKIIAALNEDASCKGWIICQQDGKIIDSVGVLEQKKEIAQSMHRIFCKCGNILRMICLIDLSKIT